MSQLASVTAEQREKMTALHKTITDAGMTVPFTTTNTPSPEEHCDIVLFKLLTARAWNVPKAFDMVKDIAEFRSSRGLDGMALFPTPPNLVRGFDQEDVNLVLKRPTREPGEIDAHSAAMSTCYSGTWHKTDKKGHPVYIERTGLTDVHTMVEVLKSVTKPGEDYHAPALNAHIFCNEVGGALVQYQRLKNNTEHMNTVVVISDCAGLGLGHLYKPALAILETMSKSDQKVYPEGLHKMYLVNCPSMVTMAFNLIKSWLDPRVQAKIVFCKPHETAATLREVISPENLPKELGGTCECPNECVPKPTKELPSEYQSTAQTEHIQIAAGQLSTRYFKLIAGQTASWDFCTEKHNIAYSATFTPHSAPQHGSSKHHGSSARTLHAKDKVECCSPDTLHFSFTADVEGVLTLTFDNTYSWMHAKSVLLRMAMLEN
eukprot:PhM_4_TR11501/c0_g1_i1/m.97085